MDVTQPGRACPGTETCFSKLEEILVGVLAPGSSTLQGGVLGRVCCGRVAVSSREHLLGNKEVTAGRHVGRLEKLEEGLFHIGKSRLNVTPWKLGFACFMFIVSVILKCWARL